MLRPYTFILSMPDGTPLLPRTLVLDEREVDLYTTAGGYFDLDGLIVDDVHEEPPCASCGAPILTPNGTCTGCGPAPALITSHAYSAHSRHNFCRHCKQHRLAHAD